MSRFISKPNRCWDKDGCHVTGKNCYAKRTYAKQAMRNMLKKGAANLTVYRCSDCNFYHIGHRRNVPRHEKKRAVFS